MHATQFALLVLLTTSTHTVEVRVDTTNAPDAMPFVAETEVLVKEWYPKIHEILSGPDAPPAYREIQLIFQREHRKHWAAWVDQNRLFVSEDSLRNRVDSYGGMIAHEIAHLAQNYNYDYKDATWVVEGTADYIRHKYFERDIRPKLQVKSDGRLWGYGAAEPYNTHLQDREVDLRKRGYRHSYTIASAFLFWLEEEKDPAIIRILHRALATRTYSPKVFEQHCGAKLDVLWTEFIAQSQRP